MSGSGRGCVIKVISMAGAQERRAAFAATVTPGAPAWEFFDARTGPTPSMDYDPERVRRQLGRDMGPGEIGCYASHYAIWEELAGSDNADDRVLVVEDDVVLDWAFVGELVASAEPLPPYLRLYYKRPVPFRLRKKGYVNRARALIELYGLAYGTQAYVISRDAARRLVSHCRVVRCPIDDAMDRVWEHGVRNFALFPCPAFERSVASSIGTSRYVIEKKPDIGLAGRIVRKLRYYVGYLAFRLR